MSQLKLVTQANKSLSSWISDGEDKSLVLALHLNDCYKQDRVSVDGVVWGETYH